MTPKKESMAERLETIITMGGKLPNAFAVADAIVQFNTKTVKRLVAKFHELPEDKRRALGLAANLLLTVLENELASRSGHRKRKRK